MKRLIFDLRDNTGGYFDQALLLSDFFLPKGASVVYIEGLHRPRKEYRADGKGQFQNVKLVLLVDEGSASSSEIFAGAIQDDRGVIVGRRTFGKGLVQEPLYSPSRRKLYPHLYLSVWGGGVEEICSADAVHGWRVSISKSIDYLKCYPRF
ncbi:MAG: hypothetical protein K6F58_04880 [Bacteroidales bacterium]|nr:hypothetical protein [Bacteroidales bacterium]